MLIFSSQKMKHCNSYFKILVVTFCVLTINCSYNQFDDTILYNIKWLGKSEDTLLVGFFNYTENSRNLSYRYK